ncbi:GCN5 family acetyltransferase [Afipia sp. P52-10]|jgi:GNAT superfamily N-acetyltransferase|uniref:GNAT family N-acetyltransferase n=1 Tax=Afipia sp. P52-10 TaxID=1429916 RepID=UPI0003DF1EF9|nr:GNAT family N-acetyltransferase [Afipia sp. P52-10]ETR78376.1 GCN5 family acetyltransferase [Afipia sp. P52-10]
MAIRTIAVSDLPAATVLLGQLGYPMPEQEVARRLAAVLGHADHRVWVYDDGGEVVGLLHAFFRPALDKPPEVMVQALVTDATRRSTGVGEALMQVVEAWARERGCQSVALYSRIDRERAHRFYERLGYEKKLASAQLRKALR